MKPPIIFITTLFFCCFLQSTVTAQDDKSVKKDKRTYFGLFAGLNSGKTSFEPELYESSANLGYQFGFFVRSGGWGYIQSGLLYQKLSQDLTTGSSFPIDESDNLNVGRIEIPALIGLNVLPIGKNLLNIRAFAGPTFSYAVGVSDNTLSFEAGDLNRLQMDLGGGIGLDVLIMKLDFGYNYGLANFMNGQTGHLGYAYVTFGLGF